MKRIADARKTVVAMPPIARIQPTPVELALRTVPPELQDITIAGGVRKYTRYHPNHYPLNTLGTESHLGSRTER